MRFKASAFVCLALLLCGDPSEAQEVTNSEEEAASYFVLEEVLMRRSDDPTLRSPLAVPQPKLILEATDDGETLVKARVGFEILKRLILDLQVESPRSSSGKTTLATADGLSEGSTGEVGFTWVGWNPAGYGRTMQSFARTAEAEGNNWSMSDYLEPATSRPSAVAMLGQKNYKDAVEKYQDAMPWWIPFLTARAKAGRQEFHFVDEVTLESDDQSHAHHQFTASAGAYMGGRVYSAVSYRRGKAFTEGRTASICSPFEETDSLECRDLVLGPPEKGTTEGLEFEIRRLFGSFGVAARLSRDLQDNFTAVELPIYFLQKLGASEMELNGGVAIKWRSDTDDFALSLFIGPSLSTVFRMNGR